MFMPPKKPIKYYATAGFDIETYDSDNKFLLCSIYFSENKYYTFYDKFDFVSFLIDNAELFRNCRIFAHNLQFDFNGIFADTEYFKDFKITPRDSGYISARSYVYDGKFNYFTAENHHHTPIYFYDTFNFYQGKLEEIGKIINIPKMKQPDNFGKYPKTESELKYIIDYNLNDSKVTKYFADFLQSTFNSLGGELKSTIASTSMDLFRRKYLLKNYYTPNIEDIKQMYNCYYGGRTEIFNRGLCDEGFKIYDFNSLYPSVMRDFSYPIQNSLHKSMNPSWRYIQDFDGFCDAELCFNENIKIPYLCTRKDGKLIFPRGHFKGTYTHIELRNAKELGYKISNLKKCFYYTKNEFLFKDFVEDLYKKRMDFKAQNSPLEVPVKILMNSLYGKFGQKLEHDELVHADVLSGIEEYSKAKQVGNTDYFIRKIETKQNEISFINPILAAYVTAYARLKLYNSIVDIQDNVFYMDTDSIFTPKKLNNSSELGDLKIEFEAKSAILVKPKFYAAIGKDKNKIKIKGVSSIKDLNMFDLLIAEQKAISTKFTKLRESLRRNLPVNSIIQIIKKLDLEDNKRDWMGKKFNMHDFQDSKPLVL